MLLAVLSHPVSLPHPPLHAYLVSQFLATFGFLLQVATLWLVLSKQQTYLRYRRAICLAHCIVICWMVYNSLPLLDSRMPHTSLFARLLSYLFRLGSLLPISITAMHRVPWQHVVLCCAIFCSCAAAKWPQDFCTELVGNATNSTGNLDMLTGMASALDYLTGQGGMRPMHQQQQQQQQADSSGSLSPSSMVWQSTAHSIAAACVPNSSSNSSINNNGMLASPLNRTHSGAAAGSSSTAAVAESMDCSSLLQGQCVAVSRTILVWFGILVIAAVAIGLERYSKWLWVQKHTPAMRGRSNVPDLYKEKCWKSFIKSQLLQLHVLLDVPLVVLWFGFCYWSRPVGVLQQLQ